MNTVFNQFKDQFEQAFNEIESSREACDYNKANRRMKYIIPGFMGIPISFFLTSVAFG